MRKIVLLKSFKRDYKRESRGRYKNIIDNELEFLMQALSKDEQLPNKYREHILYGNWVGHTDCHIKPDLVFIYKATETEVECVRLGSHSELFG